jgi:formate dehydrogenase major subunit
MFDAAIDGSFKGLYVQGEDIAQSDPTPSTSRPALAAMECVVVQDLFLNETAKYAHVFLPGSTLPREGRHLHQRRAAHQPRAQGDAAARRQGRLGGHACALANALGYPMHYDAPVARSWTRSRG